MLETQRLRRILRVARIVVGELDLETVLQHVIEEARDLTEAGYVALGVLDADRQDLERFLTLGMDRQLHEALGDLPRGRGVLGTLISDPRTLRLSDVSAHQHSYGFPAGHPHMRSFLGVPVLVGGEVYGNLYLTEKAGSADFDDADEDAIVCLAEWAGVAIGNARAYQVESERRQESEQAVRALEATTAIARAIGVETDLGRVLELIAGRARDLVDARGVLILLREGEDLAIVSVAGDLGDRLLDVRVPCEGTVSGRVMRTGHVERVADLKAQSGFALAEQLDATSALFVPLIYRGQSVGVLNAFDPGGGGQFTPEHERLLESFAASAATAVATAQTVASEGLSRSIEASERERKRWARELHDETLQELAGLKVLLSSARRTQNRQAVDGTLDLALEQIDTEIAGLRRLIADLRPAELDAFGVKSAVEGLAERVAATSGLEIDLDIDLAFESGRADERPDRAIENTLYRLVQEALSNTTKHAAATSMSIEIVEAGGTIDVAIEDDGLGFHRSALSDGFGLVGMQERAALHGGALTIVSVPGTGTTISASIPVPATPSPRSLGPG